MFMPAMVISLVGVLEVLLVVALIVLLIVGVRWLLGLVGWTIPPPIWGIIGVVVILAFLIWVLSGSTPSVVIR